MFTGIITDIGTITQVVGQQDRTIFIETQFSMDDIALGDSICCSGTCLTVISKNQQIMGFDVSAETLSKTTLGTWQAGQKVNLEQALRLGQPFGGHQVSGHVDNIAQITAFYPDGDSWHLTIKPKTDYMKYLAPKGSVVIDGISLTINDTTTDEIHLNIIPHTYQHTIVQYYQVGQMVNLEIDTIVRYMAHYLDHLQRHQ